MVELAGPPLVKFTDSSNNCRVPLVDIMAVSRMVGFKKRDGNPEEGLERRGSVNFSRLVHGILDVLQTGKIKHHVIAGPSPDQSQDDHDPGGIWMSQEIVSCGQYPKLYEDHVYKSIHGKQGTENYRVGYQGGGARAEISRYGKAPLNRRSLLFSREARIRADISMMGTCMIR